VNNNWKLFLKESERNYFGNNFSNFLKIYNKLKKNKLYNIHDKVFHKQEVPLEYYIPYKMNLQYIGAGSFRSVFDLDEDWVLKVAFSLEDPFNQWENFKRARKMNEEEYNVEMHTKYPNIFPKFGPHASNYSWIVAEKVEPANELFARQYFPAYHELDKLIPSTTFGDFFILYVRTEEKIDQLLRKFHLTMQSEQKEIDKIKSILKIPHPDKNDYINAIEEFNITNWDFKINNFGIVNRDGKKRMILIDPGIGLRKWTV